MRHIHSTCPKEGNSIAIAFSGGLDTRTAVLWLQKKKLKVYAYTADLAQPDEKDIQTIPKLATEYGACKAKLLDCKQALAREGLLALQCGAFHIQSAGRKYFNTTPLARAVTTFAIVQAMKKDKVYIFGDGSTHRGNDIQRFYRYGILLNPALEIYKPWLDADFISELGGRTEMSSFLEKHKKPYHISSKLAYSTDSNVLGATHEAKDLEYLYKNMYIVQPIMGVPFWDTSCQIENEVVNIRFENGWPTAINNIETNDLLKLILNANKIAGRHGLGMSDQIENRVIEAKSRGIYEAPGMALLHIAYERLLATTHNENMLDIYFIEGRRLSRLLYEGRWYDPEANLLKDSLSRWLASPISGEVKLELRRGDDYSILETKARFSNYEPEKLSMEKTEGSFTATDRIGALSLQDLSLESSRNLLGNYIENKKLKNEKGFLPDISS